MANQDEGFAPIQFSITTPFQNVRLLEVPSDVLDIITKSNNSNEITTLKFKSAPASTSVSSLARNSSTHKSKDSILHLCSDDKAWAVKQVSTSNSVYLIQPGHIDDSSPPNITTTTNGDVVMDGDEDGIEATVTGGHITATSQVRNFLELHPAQIHESDIEQSIFDLVPFYHLLEDGCLADVMPEAPVSSLHELIEDIAAPDAIVHRIGMRLCVFEGATDSTKATDLRCYIPSPTALLAIWTRIIEGCSIEMIRLEHAIVLDRIIGVLNDPQEKCIAEVMFKFGGMFDHIDLTESSNTSSASDEMSDGAERTRYFKAEKTCDFVAELILKARIYALSVSPDKTTSQQGIEREDFMKQWTALIPTSFIKYCTLEDLQSKTGIEIQREPDGNEVVRWVANDFGLISNYRTKSNAVFSSAVLDNEQETVTKAAAPGKRKWHEKFGAQRNAMKR